MNRAVFWVAMGLLGICIVLMPGVENGAVAGELPDVESPPVVVLPPDEEPKLNPSRDTNDERAVGELNLSPDPFIYGVNFMSSAEEPADALRYQNAHATGAQWNRWPFYWHSIELVADNFDFSSRNHDAVVAADIENGLLINAILMGIPGFYFRDGQPVPNTLYEPIFSDGTDIPGPGKTIYINNKWARYVEATVNQYKPGGVLAQQRGWDGLEGIRQWEIWNEPDLPDFFRGSKQDYARLLKVAYFAVKHADPGAEVIFGAMANNYLDENYYRDVLQILSSDPQAQQYGYFHDIFATHNYYYPWGNLYQIERARNVMALYGINKRVWLNETGMPAWNDYPGPVWASDSHYRGTVGEQADYTVMTAFYSFYVGADAIFHFQLYDGCGNQPGGNDFPVHNGELCTADGRLVSNPDYFCYGDAYGLYRNGSDAACFTHHPNPETGREMLSAFQLVTQYLQDSVPLSRMKQCSHSQPDDDQEWIAFYRPNTNQRIMALWSCIGANQQAVVPAIGDGAELLTPDGGSTFISPTDGFYYLTLPGATNRNYPNPEPDFWYVGGRPFVLVERDLQPPSVDMSASEVSEGIGASWWADDATGSGVASFTVLASIDGRTPTVWLNETTDGGGIFTESYDFGVEFTVTAEDYGGNTSEPVKFLVGELPPVDPPVVQFTANRTEANIFDTIVYELRVTNPSDRVNDSVRIRNALPVELDFGRFITSGGAWVNNDVIEWNGEIAANSTRIIRYEANRCFGYGV